MEENRVFNHQKKYRLQIFPQNKTISANDNDLLADKILETGINLSVYCNKKGLCGKCLVEIVKGRLQPLGEREKLLINQKGLDRNYRLACLSRIQSDLSIRIPEASIIKEMSILESGIKSPIFVDPSTKKYYLELKKPRIKSPSSLMELIESKLKVKNLIISLDLLKELSPIMEKSNFRITAALFNCHEIVSIEPGQTLNRSFGIAIDIGTTTLVAELLDLNSGESIDHLAAMNNQVRYGSDVVSRITFAFRDPKNLKTLRNSIVKDLNSMIEQLLEKNKIDRSFVYEIAIAGNTSMNHFLLGLPVKTLALSPFHSVFSTLSELSSDRLGLKINKYGKIYISPNIKSFVGGDISAGLLASDFENRKGNYLFIDLGTNGEVVLKTSKGFVATSTAAGPAFEGMNTSSGMVALPGAVYKAEYRNRLRLFTIENRTAAGICGTGFIDLISIFLYRGRITSKGAIVGKTKRIPIFGKISITQKDVREIQLATAAIKSGIKVLLHEYSLNINQLDGIFIAGAFGNYLNIRNSMKIGLLPKIDEKKIFFIGNSSLAGARALLLSRHSREKIEHLVKKIHYLSLATNPLFQNTFIEALEFKN